MKATFVRKQPENLGQNIQTFWFESDSALDQIAGQYILLTLPHKNADERGEDRWFTLSSSPTDAPLFSITTKLFKKRSTFKNTLNNLKSGDIVSVSEPMGDFVLPMDPAIPLVFIAIGVGITPFHSIIKYLVDKKQHRNITLLYSASSGEEIIFQDLIGKAWINSSLIIRDKSGLNQSKAARLTGLQVLKSTEPPKDSLFYLAGPEQAVEDLQKQLVRLGVDLSRLVIDNFTGY